MIQFTAIILKFANKGEKTGWTCIEVSAALAEQLTPGNKKSFRVKGKIDNYPLHQIALLPMGDGNFIMPLNAAIRKGIGKRKGAEVVLELKVDETPFLFSQDMMLCLEDEPQALAAFNKLPGSEQKYFSKWIESAKTEPTKAKRIAQTVNAMLKGFRYGEMIKALKKTEEK
jgi:hypothetical protein